MVLDIYNLSTHIRSLASSSVFNYRREPNKFLIAPRGPRDISEITRITQSTVAELTREPRPASKDPQNLHKLLMTTLAAYKALVHEENKSIHEAGKLEPLHVCVFQSITLSSADLVLALQHLDISESTGTELIRLFIEIADMTMQYPRRDIRGYDWGDCVLDEVKAIMRLHLTWHIITDSEKGLSKTQNALEARHSETANLAGEGHGH
ncbi:hypothetical protein H0H93_006594 [Arthromyces matolae]|nr:hypothetical protein H0H93_006594 [Arthromyces matolae]